MENKEKSNNTIEQNKSTETKKEESQINKPTPSFKEESLKPTQEKDNPSDAPSPNTDDQAVSTPEEGKKNADEREAASKTEKKAAATEKMGKNAESSNSSTEESADSKAHEKTASSHAEPKVSSTQNKTSSVSKEEPNLQTASLKESEEASSSDHEDEEEEGYDDDDHGILMKAYDEMNLDALSEELERLLKKHEVKNIRNHVREIKMEFDAKFGEKREQKKEEFLQQGGNIIDFSYSTLAERKFNKLYFDYKEKRDNYYQQVRKNLQDNLERRLAIIEELKAMTGVGNDMNANFKEFKQLQDRWRKAGAVPRNDYKDTWKTYHHYVERFYDFLHLDREFRELDYKHNLEQKLKMIARAEELGAETNIKRAFRELQNLHRMWKEEVGPVAKEYREPIWEKFSSATKKIHENRRAYYAEVDKKREENQKIKQEIITKIKALEEKEISSHRQAQNRIKEFKKLRDQFFQTGKVPRKNNQVVWNAFKEASQDFNHKKNEFYKNRKKEQRENLDKKLELVKIAEENQDSDDFEKVTPLMKKIQSDWRKIGFVKRSKSDKIWKRFKKACNHYFDRLHKLQNKKDKQALQNFDQKKTLLNEVKDMKLSGNREDDLPEIKAKIETWKSLGKVPKNKKYIEGKFNKALDQVFKELDINRKDAEMLKYENRLQSLEQADDDYKIRKEASFLRKKIDQTKDDIRKLETNLEFFSNADKDNPLMKDAFNNIDQHKQQLKIWEAKLEKLRNL